MTKRRLSAPTIFFPELEIHMLASGLQESRWVLGPEHPFVQAMLAGRSPQEVAKAAVAGSRLQDPALRKGLVEGGKAAIAASTDPMGLLARTLDPFARKLRRQTGDRVTAIVSEHGGRLTKARFQLEGKECHPDTSSPPWAPLAATPAVPWSIRTGELVGLIFDGNLESQSGNYYYGPKVNRAVSVDARAIIEALEKVYEAPRLIKELQGN